MKKLLIILFLLLSFNGLTQTIGCPEDTNTICLPINVAKEVLLDLNELDKQKTLNKNYQTEIQLLINKTEKLILVNELLEEKEHLSYQIQKKTEEKVKLLEEENKNLRQEITNVKTKNTLIGIFSGAIIGVLTYVIAVK